MTIWIKPFLFQWNLIIGSSRNGSDEPSDIGTKDFYFWEFVVDLGYLQLGLVFITKSE